MRSIGLWPNLIVLSLAGVVSLIGQGAGGVEGRVSRSTKNTPIQGAVVTLSPGVGQKEASQAKTDGNGPYSVSATPGDSARCRRMGRSEAF